MKKARKNPEILTKLERYVKRNLELRKERQHIDEEIKDSIELILQTKNELEHAIAVRETEYIMAELQEEEGLVPTTTTS